MTSRMSILNRGRILRALTHELGDREFTALAFGENTGIDEATCAAAITDRFGQPLPLAA